jgi:hypothetical protein
MVLLAAVNDHDVGLHAAVHGEHDSAVTPALLSFDSLGEINFAVRHGDSKTDISIGITRL